MAAAAPSVTSLPLYQSKREGGWLFLIYLLLLSGRKKYIPASEADTGFVGHWQSQNLGKGFLFKKREDKIMGRDLEEAHANEKP